MDAREGRIFGGHSKGAFGLKPCWAFGIVRREINERTINGERTNHAQGIAGDLFVGADTVYLSCKQQALGIAGVSGEEDRGRAEDKNGNVPESMAWGWNCENLAGAGYVRALKKGANGILPELKRFWLPPFWPAVRKIAI